MSQNGLNLPTEQGNRSGCEPSRFKWRMSTNCFFAARSAFLTSFWEIDKAATCKTHVAWYKLLKIYLGRASPIALPLAFLESNYCKVDVIALASTRSTPHLLCRLLSDCRIFLGTSGFLHSLCPCCCLLLRHGASVQTLLGLFANYIIGACSVSKSNSDVPCQLE